MRGLSRYATGSGIASIALGVLLNGCTVSATVYREPFTYRSSLRVVQIPYSIAIGSIQDEVSGRPQTAAEEIRTAIWQDFRTNSVFLEVMALPSKAADLILDIDISELLYRVNGKATATLRAQATLRTRSGVITSYPLHGLCSSSKFLAPSDGGCAPPAALRAAIEQLKSLLSRDRKLIAKGVDHG